MIIGRDLPRGLRRQAQGSDRESDRAGAVPGDRSWWLRHRPPVAGDLALRRHRAGADESQAPGGLGTRTPGQRQLATTLGGDPAARSPTWTEQLPRPGPAADPPGQGGSAAAVGDQPAAREPAPTTA